MQLEWRALRRALQSTGRDQAEAIADALAFRRQRRRLFAGAADNERRDEIREGLPPTRASPPGPIRPRMPAVPQRQRSQ